MKGNQNKKNVRYIENDVLTEAKIRIRHIISTFDTVAVCFSGGKDSWTVLNLYEEVLREDGWTGPADGKINVVFRDEELIPDDVINFVQDVAKSEKYNFLYFACAMSNEKFVLGKIEEYIQWDVNRKWIRPKPDFAITDPLNRVFNQHDMDAFIGSHFVGRLALLNGIRTDESLFRLQSVMNKRNECYMSASSSPNVKLCKPIYDWSEKDIFRYFYDKGIGYCSIYDKQMWGSEQLRVATPLHAENAKRFNLIKKRNPLFYEQLIDIFPEMLLQERYWSDYDRLGVITRYPLGWRGIVKYIMDNIEDPKMRKLALGRIKESKRIRENTISRNPSAAENFGGYPIMYVWKVILGGNFERVIQAQKTPTKNDIEYEKMCERAMVA